VIILGIETATQQVGVAVGGQEGVIASFGAARGRRHAETLAPAIDFVCRQAQVELREVSVVAVDVGPGLFTGLRVGVAAAKATAQALRVPMIGLSSLDLLAFPMRHTRRLIAAVIDARRGEVYSALYRQVQGGVQRLSDYRLQPPAELACELEASGDECLVVGDGAVRHADLLAVDSRIELGGLGYAHPQASALVELSHPRALREEFVQPRDLRVLYLRKSDAEINWDQRRPAGRPGPGSAGDGESARPTGPEGDGAPVPGRG
jgi:tRNA threonylcarbamoyladenosine biosynthesis protein TsaB